MEIRIAALGDQVSRTSAQPIRTPFRARREILGCSPDRARISNFSVYARQKLKRYVIHGHIQLARQFSMGSSILAIFSLIIIGYSVGSMRVIKEGNAALIERLGRYRSTLEPGVNFIVPLLDSLVIEDTLREQILDIKPRSATTKDNVNVDVDAIIYWRILDLEKTYYAIEDVDTAIQELVVTTLRSEIGKMDLQDTFSSRDAINKALLDVLDEATEPWGVKVNRVEVQEIKVPDEVEKSMRQQQAAEISKRAAITEAEGKQRASILEAEGNLESIRLISQAFDGELSQEQIVKFLIAQRYVDVNEKLTEGKGSKIIFSHPKYFNEAVGELIKPDPSIQVNRSTDDGDQT